MKELGYNITYSEGISISMGWLQRALIGTEGIHCVVFRTRALHGVGLGEALIGTEDIEGICR